MENTKGKTNCIVIIGILILVLGTYVSFRNYILFHFILEVFCVVVASSMGLLGCSSYSSKSSSVVNNIGIAFLFVAVVDFFHVLSYKGINIISTGSNIPTQLWILGRLLESFCILAAFMLRNRKINRVKVAIAYFIITLVSLYSIYYTNYFPECFIEGIGLTKFKIASEYVVIGAYIINIYLINKYKHFFQKSILKLLLQSFIFAALGELSFTLYTDVYGIFNALGHLFKAISYVFICYAIFFQNIHAPFEEAISNYKEELQKNYKLSLSLCIDFMTGLYNRRYLDSVIDNELVSNTDKAILIVFDMDNLKQINDRLGHIKGDKAILETSNILKNNFDKKDILIRTGGDEFLSIVIGASEEDIKARLDSIDKELIVRGKDLKIPLSISYGIAVHEGKIDKETFAMLFQEADEKMYEYKAARKRLQ